MKFELKPHHRNVSDEELLDDLRKIAQSLGKNTFSTREYIKQKGRFSAHTISSRFNGWNYALIKAGLTMSMQKNIVEKELFENLEEVWVKLGRQPNFRDMRRPLSKCTAVPYAGRFGSWRKALEAFVEYMSKNVEEVPMIEETKGPISQEQ